MAQFWQRRMASFILIIGLLSMMNTAVFGKQNGWGRINMKGAIIDTACAIDMGSRDQTIEMDTVPVSQIMRDGRGGRKIFTIKLIDCELTNVNGLLPDWQHFQVIFDGIPDGDMFQIEGEAKGVALQIIDATGNIAFPGKPLPLTNIQPGVMVLNYAMDLVGNRKNLMAGEYRSTIRFKLDYY